MKTKIMSRKSKSKLIFYCCFMALPLLQFCVFWIGVNANSILLSFKEYNFDSGKYVWYGFDNFSKVFTDFGAVPYFKSAVKNSVLVYGFSLVGTTLSILFSFYLSKKLVLSGMFKVVLFVPHILSTLVTVIIYKYFVDRAIPSLWEMITGNEIQGLLANADSTLSTIIFFNVWTGFGTGTIMYLGAMSGISDSIVEAAQIDGITPLKELFYITLPMIWPTLSTFLVVGFVGIFGSQANLYNFYGDDAEYNLYTFGYYLYRATKNAGPADYTYLAAMGLVLTAIAAPLTLGLRKLLNSLGPKTV